LKENGKNYQKREKRRSKMDWLTAIGSKMYDAVLWTAGATWPHFAALGIVIVLAIPIYRGLKKCRALQIREEELVTWDRYEPWD